MNRRGFLARMGSAVAFALMARLPALTGCVDRVPVREPVVCTYRGGHDGSWANPENWENGVVPQNGDSVIFPRATVIPAATDCSNLFLNYITIEAGCMMSRETTALMFGANNA